MIDTVRIETVLTASKMGWPVCTTVLLTVVLPCFIYIMILQLKLDFNFDFQI